MDVILLERVAKLGNMGDVVSVRDGYARNFLLPQKKALWASQANIDAFEADKADLEQKNEESKAEARKLAEKIDGEQFVVIRQASDGGALYGSVSTRDAADAAKEAGFDIDRRQVALEAPIKELGIHRVHVTLHPEVDAVIELNVARSPEEAELQAQGVDIAEQQAEEEAQAELEIAELFEDIGAAELDELETEDEQRTAKPAVLDKAELDAAADEDDA